MDCNATVGVMLPHCVLVFTEAFLQGSAGFTNVDIVTVSARDFTIMNELKYTDDDGKHISDNSLMFVMESKCVYTCIMPKTYYYIRNKYGLPHRNDHFQEFELHTRAQLSYQCYVVRMCIHR